MRLGFNGLMLYDCMTLGGVCRLRALETGVMGGSEYQHYDFIEWVVKCETASQDFHDKGMGGWGTPSTICIIY